MNIKIKVSIIVFFFVFLPTTVHATFDDYTRQREMENTLDAMEAKLAVSERKSRSSQSKEQDTPKQPAIPKTKSLQKEEESESLRNIREIIQLVFGKYAYMTLGLQTGYITGNTTYHISFSEEVLGVVYNGDSELEFPLDNFLWGIEGGVGYKNINNEKQDRARLTLRWLTDVNNGAGKMKDSDWLNDAYDIYYYGITHPGLDIYSESDADLDTNMVDVNYTFNFCPTENISIGSTIGYKYQKFKYDISNLNQVGYGPYEDDYTGSVSGRVLDYKVEYKIPYLGLSTDLLLGDKFQLNLQFGYSPWADAKDRDDHLLRYKLSTADCDGDAYLINLNANWEFLPAWILQVGSEYVNIDTDGTQHQFFYAGDYVGTTYDVDDKITSKYYLVNAAIKYAF
jgi:outer membrane protease